MGYLMVKAVLTQYQRVTNRRTDRPTVDTPLIAVAHNAKQMPDKNTAIIDEN